MNTLQKAIEGYFEKLPHLLLLSLLEKKLQDQSITLSKRKLRELTDKILKGDMNINISRRLTNNRDIIISFTDDDIKKIDKVTGHIGSFVEELIGPTSQKLLVTLKRRWPSESRARRRELKIFHKWLNEHWGDSIEKLRMLIAIAREYSSEINNAIRESTSCPPSKASEIIIRLHASSCQVAEEVVCLIQNGFADGSMARWRTLQEICAVGHLIKLHGDDLAERYELHEIVETRKAALQYQKYQKRLKQTAIPKSRVGQIEERYALVIARYGPDYKNSYGWAAEHIKKRNPSIADIQEAAGIDHLTPYYRMASHNVHANPKGIFFKLGLIGERDILLTGPSGAGLADPGHLTAISLIQISSLLMHYCATFDSVVMITVMQEIVDEIGAEFFKAHEKLEADNKDT